MALDDFGFVRVRQDPFQKRDALVEYGKIMLCASVVAEVACPAADYVYMPCVVDVASLGLELAKESPEPEGLVLRIAGAVAGQGEDAEVN